MGVVYVLVNSAFENYVKIGRTTNLERRLRSLDNTSVPLPFRCVFAVEVDDENEVERLLHQAFADNRTKTTREFFQLEDWHVIRFGRETVPHTIICTDTFISYLIIKIKHFNHFIPYQNCTDLL